MNYITVDDNKIRIIDSTEITKLTKKLPRNADVKYLAILLLNKPILTSAEWVKLSISLLYISTPLPNI